MSESHLRAADIASLAPQRVLIWPRVVAVLATLACAGSLAVTLAAAIEFKDGLESSASYYLPARIALGMPWLFAALTAASLAVTTVLIRKPAHPAARGYGNLALAMMLVAVAVVGIPLLLVLGALFLLMRAMG